MSTNAVKTGLIVGAVTALAIGQEALAEVPALPNLEPLEALPEVSEVTALSTDDVIDPGLIEVTGTHNNEIADAGLREMDEPGQSNVDSGNPSA